MGKGIKISKKAVSSVGTSVSFDKKIFKRSKAKNAVNGASKASCPILAKAAKAIKIPKKKPTTTGLKGVFGEHVSDAYMAHLGHKKLNGNRKLTQIGDSPIGNGIDGVWKGANPPPTYIITETKYGSSSLGHTLSGRQMSDKWIDKRLKAACGPKQAADIRKKMKQPNQVEKLVIHVDDSGVKSIDKLK